MKLFTKEVDKQLFAQYPKGSDLENQMVVAKIFNPYGRGVWYLLNSDPEDPDYIWAIVDLFEPEMGSVSRSELQTVKVPPFGLGLERDIYFTPKPAKEVFEGVLRGERYEKGGSIASQNKDMLENQTANIMHHAKELHEAVKNTDIEIMPWVLTKTQRAATDLQDVSHYLEGEDAKFAAGGMTAGRFYRDNSGKEFRYIGESQGKLLFKDGEKIVTKTEEDFEDGPKETKLFGFFEKGGKTPYTYIPNKDVKELMVILKGNLKKIKGTDILDGVYLKNKVGASKTSSKLTVDEAYDNILAKAEEENLDKEDLENLNKEDVKKLIAAGYNMEDLYVIYIGVKSEIEFECDNEVNSINGIFGLNKDYVERIVNSLVESGKDKKYELGLKYPLFDWKAVIKKYNIKNEPIIIEDKRSWGDKEYYINTYEVFVGDKIAIGHQIKSARYKNDKLDYETEDGNEVKDYSKVNKYQKDRDSKAGFNTGYWGIVSSEKAVLYSITKMLTSQKDGYVKDLDFFYNRLGGVGAEELDKKDIKYAKGGYMAHGGKTNSKRYTVTVYYGGEMENDEVYTDSLEEAKRISQGGEHSEIYDNEKKEFVEIEYAKGGEVDKPKTITFGELKQGEEYYQIDKTHYQIKKYKITEKRPNGYSMIQIGGANIGEQNKDGAKKSISKYQGALYSSNEDVYLYKTKEDAKKSYKIAFLDALEKMADGGEISKVSVLGLKDWNKFDNDSNIRYQYKDNTISPIFYDKYTKKYDLSSKRGHGEQYQTLKEAKLAAYSEAKFGKMAMGGKVKFEDKVKAIKASLLKRKKVSPKVQKDYGKTYSPKEAEESAKRIAGALRAKYDLKKK